MEYIELPITGYERVDLMDKSEMVEVLKAIAFAQMYSQTEEQIGALCFNGPTFAGDLITKSMTKILVAHGYAVVIQIKDESFYACSQKGDLLVKVFDWFRRLKCRDTEGISRTWGQYKDQIKIEDYDA